MKFKACWSSPVQGIQYTEIDAINAVAAKQQMESLYGNIPGFSIAYVSCVMDEKKYPENSQFTHNTISNVDEDFDDDTPLSVFVGTGFVLVGIIIAFLGLFNLPQGLIALIIGGGLGFLGMKITFWMNDRGW